MLDRFTIASLLAVLSISTLAIAAVPSTINYQGYLKNSDGTPVTTSTSVRFSLYSSNPARNNPVWRETKSITPANGVYSTQLGSETPISAPFDLPYYLGVQVEADPEMALQPLASVPYALRAQVSDSVPAASIGTAAISDSSVTTAKIAAGAVTDSQIGGTISAAKLDLSGVQKKYAKTAVVAQSGGDYTSPVTAMTNVATWCGTPSATNPCLLKIMPGIYDLGSGTLAMQQYVDIEGSGELATTITSTITGETNGTVRGANNAELRFLTVRNTAPYISSIWGIGIMNAGTSPRLSNLTVAASVASNSCGIYNASSAAPVISNVTITAVGINSSFGVVNVSSSNPTLSNVTTSALGLGINHGIHNNNAGTRLINVIATGTGGSTGYGMNSAATSGSYTIVIDRSTLEGNTNSIYNSYAGYTLKIGASKLIGPIGTIGTYQYFSSYSDTTALDSALTVKGTIQATRGALLIPEQWGKPAGLFVAEPGNENAITVVQPAYTLGTVGINFIVDESTNVGGKIKLHRTGAWDQADMSFWTAPTHSGYGDFAVERMRIMSNGNVGIGTASPAAKLDVSGTVKATTFQGDGSGLAGVAASTVTNGIYTTGSYADPAWLTALAGSKVSGNISGSASNVTGTVAIANGGTGTATGSITGSGSLAFSAGGTNSSVTIAPTGSGTVDVSAKRITNLATPSAGTDATSKNYVDATAFAGTRVSRTPQQIATLAWYSYPSYGVGAAPRGIAFDGTHLWVTSLNSDNVSKLLASSGAVVETYTVGTDPYGIAFDGANIWVVNTSSGNVTKLLASDGSLVGTYGVGNLPIGIAFDGTNIWVTNSGSDSVTKLLASTGSLVGIYSVGTIPQGIAFDGTNIWVSNSGSSNVTKLLASDGSLVGTYGVGNLPIGIAFDGTNIWVANSGSNSVSKLLASNGSLVGIYSVGTSPQYIAFDGTNIWVTNNGSNSVTKLLAASGAVVGTYRVGTSPIAVAYDGANIWVTNYANASVSRLPQQ